MAKILIEKDYTVRFDEVISKLNNKSKDMIRDYQNEYLRGLDAAHVGYDYRYGDRRGSMPKNEVKFCVSEKLNYKLNDGHHTNYKHKDHDKKLEDFRKENDRISELYKQERIDKHLEEYEVEIKPHMFSGSIDLFTNPIEVKF